MAKTLGTIIKTIRKERNISRTELADKLNISYSALQHWESDRRDVNLFSLTNILDLLQSTVTIKDTSIIVKDSILDKEYIINCSTEEDIEFIYTYNQYGIVKGYDTIDGGNIYAVVHTCTLTTPYPLKLSYYSLADAKFELHNYIEQLRFPILEEITLGTSGKLLFREQISMLLSRLGLDNPSLIIKDIGKRKMNGSIEKIKERCVISYGEKDGQELFEIIIEAISGCYKRVLLDDIVKGYDGFLKALTKSTKGSLQNIHQKHALLKILDTNNKYNTCSYLSSYEEYDTAILDIINEDIYKYGYPSFYKNVTESINKAKTILEISSK